MPDRKASETALAVAALRAAHQLVDPPPFILDDPVSARLLDPGMVGRMREASDRLNEPRTRSLRCHVLLRSRYSEDRLEAAVARGVTQCLILGAGYDTFAYRQPPWAGALRIFEVDHPLSQRAKRDRLEAAGIAPPDNLEFVSLDFDVETLQAGLLRSGFDPARPAFISCLGVMMYLGGETVKGIFGFAAALPSGSEIVFTFSPPRGSPDAGDDDWVAVRAAEMGEPLRSRVTHEQLGDDLRAIGFSSVAFLDAREAVDRYIGTHEGALPAPRGVRIGSAST